MRHIPLGRGPRGSAWIGLRARLLTLLVWASAAAAPLSCGTDPSPGPACSAWARVRIVVVPHYSVSKGLQPGSRSDQVRDGWKITYETFSISLGSFKGAPSGDAEVPRSARVEESGWLQLDLMAAPELGYPIKTFQGVSAAGQWEFEYAARSIGFAGSAEKGPDRITFSWGFPAPMRFANCGAKGRGPGFIVPCYSPRQDRATVDVRPTIHGERWFQTSLVARAEVPELRADWLKTCDKDHNGELTLDELKACDAATALPQAPAGPYDLTGVIDHDGDGTISVYDFVASQVQTLGGFDDTGDCPTVGPL